MISTSNIESALGCWRLTDWRPVIGEPLGRFLVTCWLFEGRTAFARERIFPDTTFEIVVQLDASYRLVQAGALPFPPVSVGGIRTAAVTIEGPDRPVRVLGLRLRPAGAFALLRTSLADLTDRDEDLHAVIGRAAVELAERCSGASSAARCVQAAIDWSSARLAHTMHVDSDIDRVRGRIEASGGIGTVCQLEEATQRSRSRFAQRFRHSVGLGPKAYARIIRFRNALDLLQKTVHGLQDVALSAGYYDQAHMNAEFGVLAGMTPRAFRRAQHYPNSASIAQTSESEQTSKTMEPEVAYYREHG